MLFCNIFPDSVDSTFEKYLCNCRLIHTLMMFVAASLLLLRSCLHKHLPDQIRIKHFNINININFYKELIVLPSIKI